jgi:hypothetical protein
MLKDLSFLIQKLDPKLVSKEINQIAIFQANRLIVQDLLVLDNG